MATAKVGNKLLFGDTSGKLPWGHIKEDMLHFKSITEVASGRIFACSRSTYTTLPVKARNRLKPMIVVEDYTRLTEMLNTTDMSMVEIVVLGGRKLIDSCIPEADHIMISDIGNVEHKDSFIYLRDETVAKLSDFEQKSTCFYFNRGGVEVVKGAPYLRQAYVLSKD
ncbi:MAG: dihydrofolate reductase [Phocaeicola sp.]